MKSKNDNAILGVGIIILLISLSGAAVLEGEKPGDNDLLWDVFFSQSNRGIHDANGYTSEGESTHLTVEVTEPYNITALTFELVWVDDDTSEGNINGIGVVNQPDTFKLTVTDPSGVDVREVEGSNTVQNRRGVISLSFSIHEIEGNMSTLTAGSAAALRERFMLPLGFGNWTVSIACINAGDAEALGTTVEEDDGNEWTLNVSAEFYTIREIRPHEIPVK